MKVKLPWPFEPPLICVRSGLRGAGEYAGCETKTAAWAVQPLEAEMPYSNNIRGHMSCQVVPVNPKLHLSSLPTPLRLEFS